MEKCVVILITLHVTSYTNALQCNSVLQCANKLEVEVDLQSGRVIPSADAVKTHVSFIYGPTSSSAPDQCDGQAVVRLDFSGPYKKIKMELMYGKEPRLWTASISSAPTTYGFGWNYGYSSNCAAAEVYNDQFRVYSNKLPGFMYHVTDGNSLMAVADEVVEKGANMTIDITDEAVSWKTFFVNSSERYWDDIKNSRHLFTLSEQEPAFGPPTDSFIYAAFNRVPYGNFHNGSGLCKVRITFKRELGKGKRERTPLCCCNLGLQICGCFSLFTRSRIITELLVSVFTLQNVSWSAAAGEMINLAWEEFTLARTC